MSGCRLILAVVLAASLAACESTEQIQAEQDEADVQRCAAMGVPIVPGDPGYIQCRMWAAQMRLQEVQQRQQSWMIALQAFSALQRRQRAMPPYDDAYGEALPPPWIGPPPAPVSTWCRPVGQWTSC